ncbi:class A beta-lactamase [Georgenia faecalis]|uniref:Beta-lactamase n=1 Tax=Georgenia faecalis TaxID=2483799 RepID=A0ABV9DA66_9MICO|nr:class A beta-lactamase [Georgenia faecalis]
MTSARIARVALAAALSACAVVGCSAPAPAPSARPSFPAPTTTAPPSASAAPTPTDITADLDALETEFDARVGVSALDTETGRSVEYRAEERFGYASTLKVFAAAELLREVPPEEREARVVWTQEEVDAAGYSPVTSEHLDGGLTVAELAEAAVRESDNTAMNLVLDRIGGPAGLDAGLAALGDETTDVVSNEPSLNEVDAGGTRDTTTPAAFTAALDALLQPRNLAPDDLATLLDWMSGNATGDALIRAGAPADWVVRDKSGGAGGIRNDIALVTPPGRAPIVVTVLTEKNDRAAEYDDELVARVAEVVIAALD